MAVKSIYSEAEFNSEVRAPGKLVVVDFFATWCGPCKMIAPFIEQLAGTYNDVNFLKVNEADCRELIVNLGVSAFPTFYFYLGGNKVDELKGADPRQLQSKIEYYRTQIPAPFGGTALQLGSSSTDVDPREARLRKLGQKPVSEAEAQRMMSEALAKAASAPAPAATQEQPMDVAPAASSSEPSADLVNQLVEMGFSEIRAKKAATFGRNLDDAINWLTEHQDDPDIDEPIATQEDLDHQAAMQLAEEESADQEVPMTEEEKAAKVAELKEKLAKRRAEREEAEKAAELERERQRREMGKKISQTSQELEAMQRKREAEKAKREKEEAKRERERLRAEIARDKAERRAHGGKLASKLGVEGYNPSALQYDATEEAQQVEERKQPTIDDKPAEEQVTWSIERMARYRVAGDGGVALRTVRKLIDNIVTNPSEEKFRSINMENKALKQRVFALVGGLQILKAVGFQPAPEEQTRLVLSLENTDMALLTQTRAKLDAAIEVYSQVNPGY